MEGKIRLAYSLRRKCLQEWPVFSVFSYLSFFPRIPANSRSGIGIFSVGVRDTKFKFRYIAKLANYVFSFWEGGKGGELFMVFFIILGKLFLGAGPRSTPEWAETRFAKLANYLSSLFFVLVFYI